MEAMKPPFFPLYQRLRKHLEADPIGTVGFVRAGHADSRMPPGTRCILRSSEVVDHGHRPYEAFLALDWLGPLKRVQTMGRLSSSGVDALALFQTEHTRGMANSTPVSTCLAAAMHFSAHPAAMFCSTPTGGTLHARPSTTSTGRKVSLYEPFIAAASTMKRLISAT